MQSACRNGMPGSIVQASPGGTSPRTIKLKPELMCNTFEESREIGGEQGQAAGGEQVHHQPHEGEES